MEENKSLVWWVAVAIVVLVVVAFVLYYLRSSQAPQANYLAPVPDSVSSIESDLKTTDLTGLGSELSDIDKELAK